MGKAYQQMRVCLALACIYGNYFCWDDFGASSGGGGHGALYWFEEYDQSPNWTGQKGWMGRPKGAFLEPQTNSLIRYFDNGVVLLNLTGSSYTFSLNGTYQRLLGTQVPSINNGAVCAGSVTVPAWDGLFLKLPGMTRATIQNYNSDADQPLYWWPLTDAAGSSTCIEKMGTGNNLTVVGGVTLGSPSVNGETCAVLDGSSGYFTSATEQFAPTSFTLEFAFKTSIGPGTIIFLDKVQAGVAVSTSDRVAYIGTDGRLYFAVGNYEGGATFTGTIVMSRSPLFDNKWHVAQCICEGNAGNLLMRVDGPHQQAVAMVSGPLDGGLPYHGNGHGNGWWKVGSGAPDTLPEWINQGSLPTYFNGSLAHLKVYDKALSEARCKAHAASFLSRLRTAA